MMMPEDFDVDPEGADDLNQEQVRYIELYFEHDGDDAKAIEQARLEEQQRNGEELSPVELQRLNVLQVQELHTADQMSVLFGERFDEELNERIKRRMQEKEKGG